jgi:hypothetical protein
VSTVTAMDRAQAPAAPGQLGQPIPAADLLRYLDALGRWRADRRQELDRIDAAAMAASDADSYTADVTLAMTMWQSVTERLAQLTKIWDDGRVGVQQREEMSRLIWGTGSGLGSSGGLGLSLVEACRLSDALTAALRARLAFDPVAADVAARIAATRASLQRSADARPTPSTDQKADKKPDVDDLRRRLEDLAGQATRGSDVTGPFAVVEAAAARLERDLIVGAASHRTLGRDYRATLERCRVLEAQEEELRVVVARAVAAVRPTPRMAVPDVERLGKVPQNRVDLDAFRARLDNVERAMTMASAAYAKVLAELTDLRARLDVYAVKAASTGQAADPVVKATYDLVHGVLWSVPCPINQARELVTAYQRLLGSTPPGGSPS